MLSSGIVCSPSPTLAAPAKRVEDLVERHDHVHVIRRPAQPLDEPGKGLAPPDPEELIGDVGAGEPGVSGHGA